MNDDDDIRDDDDDTVSEEDGSSAGPKSDTVPMPVAYAIFGVLGVLIVASFVFAGWSIWRFVQISGDQLVLAMGKNIYVEEIEYEYEEEGEDPPALSVTVHGSVVEFDEYEPPVILENRPFVPIRGVFEALGFMVSWDEDTQSAMFSDGTNTIMLTMEAEEFITNGDVFALDTPARFYEEIAMFPIAPLVRSLGYGVHWDVTTNVVSVFVIPPPTPEPTPTPIPTPTPRPPAPTPRPTPTPTPTPPPPVTCHSCHGVGVTDCASCNGVGGGRGRPAAGVPYEISETADVWWCTACGGSGTMTCRTCAGAGEIGGE